MSMIKTELPGPSVVEMEHSLKLIEHLKQILTQNKGKMSFMQYIAEVLYAKGLGYYASGAHKLGAGGDFVTAPMISPAFSTCVARACAPVLQTLTNPYLLEIGAGTGVMAADILLELQRQQVLPERYYILETSPDLKQRQQQTIQDKLPTLQHLVHWIDTPLTEAFNGVIVANELLDALPVFRFKKQANQIVELGVGMKNGRFVELPYSFDNIWLQNRVAQIEKSVGEFPEGYCSEVNLTIKPWLEAVTSSLQAGACFFIDYGYTQKVYYDSARIEGTLNCYYKHLMHSDPFVYPGLQDITSHVDFSALAESADALGLKVNGFATQNAWLLSLGLEAVANSLIKNGEDVQKTQQAVRQLISPACMGESFHVMALSRNIKASVLDFGGSDRRYLL